MSKEYKGIKAFEYTLKTPEEINSSFVENLEKDGILKAFRDTGHILYEKGWAPFNAGNISIRTGRYHQAFLITASGSEFRDITEEDIVSVNGVDVSLDDVLVGISCNFLDCDLSLSTIINSLRKEDLLKPTLEDMDIGKKEIEEGKLTVRSFLDYFEKKGKLKCSVDAMGYKPPSSETLLHALLYARKWNKETGEINAIIHCHEPTTIESPSVTVPRTKEELGYGTLPLAVDAVESIDDNKIILLKNHGVIAVASEYTYGIESLPIVVNKIQDHFIIEGIPDSMRQYIDIVLKKCNLNTNFDNDYTPGKDVGISTLGEILDLTFPLKRMERYINFASDKKNLKEIDIVTQEKIINLSFYFSQIKDYFQNLEDLSEKLLDGFKKNTKLELKPHESAKGFVKNYEFEWKVNGCAIPLDSAISILKEAYERSKEDEGWPEFVSTFSADLPSYSSSKYNPPEKEILRLLVKEFN